MMVPSPRSSLDSIDRRLCSMPCGGVADAAAGAQGYADSNIGYINVCDVQVRQTVANLERSVLRAEMDADAPVIDAIDVMRRSGEDRSGTRTRRSGQEVPAGIVTMKDLVEELLGELAEW